MLAHGARRAASLQTLATGGHTRARPRPRRRRASSLALAAAAREAAQAAGALAAFLRAVLVARGGRAPKGVREDLAEVLRLHFRHLPAMASGALAGAGEGVTSQEARH